MSAPYYRAGQYYVDNSTSYMPVLYRCTLSGDKNTSVWAKISGGGGNPTIEIYNNTHAYGVGSIVFVFTTVTVSGVTITPGTYACINAVPANGTANQIPQFPLPTSGAVYWYCIALGIVVVNTCSGGSNASVYLNASGTF